jgi:outer membrane lipoprotein-sorting protein
MICFDSTVSRTRWFLHIWTAVLLFCGQAIAQQATPSAPLTANEIMARVVSMNERRTKALAGYSSVRTYHLESHGMIAKKADMVVRANYSSPNKKDFAIVSEDGSDTVRHKVFRRLLEAEQESMQDDNQQRSAITPDNYAFRLLNHEKNEKDEFYLLQAQPRSKNKFLFRGRIWVDAKDFAITRVEGEPAVNPSWWTKKTDFTRTYTKVGEFWLPLMNKSVSVVRIVGTAELTIEYQGYEITPLPAEKLALLPQGLSLQATP